MLTVAVACCLGSCPGTAEAGCGHDQAVAFGCDTNDVINCGIQKVHELDLLLASPAGDDPDLVDEAMLEILDVAEYGARDESCGGEGFVGWAWANALLALVELEVHGLEPGSVVRDRLASELPHALDAARLCGHRSPAPLQDTAAEQILGDYLAAELAMMLELDHAGPREALDAAAARCLDLAFTTTGGAERNVLRLPEQGHAVVFNHQQESPFYGFALLNVLAVVQGVATQLGTEPAHRADPELVRELYAWIEHKSSGFTRWQRPGQLVASAVAKAGLERVDRGGCLDTRPSMTGWPGRAAAVDETVWDAIASCYSPSRGIARTCDRAAWAPVRAVTCRDPLGYPPCFAATIEHLIGTSLEQCQNLEAELQTVPARYRGSLRVKYEVYYLRWGHDALAGCLTDPVSAPGLDRE